MRQTRVSGGPGRGNGGSVGAQPDPRSLKREQPTSSSGHSLLHEKSNNYYLRRTTPFLGWDLTTFQTFVVLIICSLSGFGRRSRKMRPQRRTERMRLAGCLSLMCRQLLSYSPTPGKSEFQQSLPPILVVDNESHVEGHCWTVTPWEFSCVIHKRWLLAVSSRFSPKIRYRYYGTKSYSAFPTLCKDHKCGIGRRIMWG
jgi:hypothetical protein